MDDRKLAQLEEYIDFTPIDGDHRTLSLRHSFDELARDSPMLFNKIFCSSRRVLEPGAGARGMTVFLYRYFRDVVFPNGFPKDFSHIAIELQNVGPNHPQTISDEQLSESGESEIAKHYSLRKGVNMIPFLKSIEVRDNPFDLIFLISVLDVVELDENNSDSIRLYSREYNLHTFASDVSNALKVGGYVVVAASPDECEAFYNHKSFKKVWPVKETRDTFVVYERVA